MFSNPGRKLKTFIIVLLIVETISGGILGAKEMEKIFYGLDGVAAFAGFLIGAVISFFVGYAGSLFIFAFADMVDNVEKIHNNLYTIGQHITKD